MRTDPIDFIFRMVSVVIIAILIGVMIGCTSPSSVQFAPLLQVNDSGNGSLNGNTVTPVTP